MEQTYAIVDLETTSSNLKLGKLIQIGIVFVKNNQIIGSYATDVNPTEPISSHVTQLTGITDEQVKDAPLFSEIAEELINLLTDCVFVAHNAKFDFNFLNLRLTELGYGKLQIPAIDTVELTQLAYPTLDSYRLSDLAKHFALFHNAPHQADSDAYVTAELFIQVTAKLKQLPKLTMEWLIKLGNTLSFQTRQYLRRLAEELVPQERDDLVFVNNIPIRKEKDIEIEADFDLQLRPQQQELVEIIQTELTTKTKNILIEAPTGIGKTLAYLQAFADKITKYQPLIISTSTQLLQEQILAEVAKLNATREYQLRVASLKSSKHYLDLRNFCHQLQQKLGAVDNLWRLKIISWLQETTTGDLEEINCPQNSAYLRAIRTIAYKKPKKSSAFYAVDYYTKCLKQARQAEVIVVNHAFLLAEDKRVKPLLPKTKYLVVDEAHKFVNTFSTSAEYSLNEVWLKQQIKQIRKETTVYNRYFQADLFDRLSAHYSELVHNYVELFKQKYTDYLDEANWSIVVSFKELTAVEHQLRSELLECTTEMTIVVQQMQKLACQIVDLKAILLLQELQQFIDLLYLFFGKNKFQEVYTEIEGHFDQINFSLLSINHKKLENSNWYQRFAKCFFIGSTLLADGKNDYFKRELQLTDVKTYVITNNWVNQNETPIYVLTDQEAGEQWYNEAKLATLLSQMVQKPTTKKILCLMTSHKAIEKTYDNLMTINQEQTYLLAQDITGTRQRNLKAFKEAKQAIWLGADMLWEGLNIPGEDLQAVVIAKLPFKALGDHFEIYRQKQLKEQGLTPFYDDALPQAMIKLKQAFGRLFRSESDTGSFVILDKRFVTSNYASKIQKAFNPTNPIITTTAAEFLAKLDNNSR